jgi:hypothetical protein
MDNAVGVRVGKRIGRLTDEIDDAARVHRTAGDHARERLARGELEDGKEVSLILADLVELGDVGMRQLRGGARFLDELLAAFRIGGDVGTNHLDGHCSPEPRVARAQHLAEAAGPDAIEDLVLTKRLDHEVGRLY